MIKEYLYVCELHHGLITPETCIEEPNSIIGSMYFLVRHSIRKKLKFYMDDGFSSLPIMGLFVFITYPYLQNNFTTTLCCSYGKTRTASTDFALNYNHIAAKSTICGSKPKTVFHQPS